MYERKIIKVGQCDAVCLPFQLLQKLGIKHGDRVLIGESYNTLVLWKKIPFICPNQIKTLCINQSKCADCVRYSNLEVNPLIDL